MIYLGLNNENLTLIMISTQQPRKTVAIVTKSQLTIYSGTILTMF